MATQWSHLDRRSFFVELVRSSRLLPPEPRPVPPAASRFRCRAFAAQSAAPCSRADKAGYSAAAHLYNERFDSIQPLAVARPDTAAGARDAVRWAVSKGVRLRARSGGHSYAGILDAR